MQGDGGFRIPLRILLWREKNLKGEETVRIEAGIHAQNVKQAAAEQASARKQDCGETKLQNRKCVTRDAPPDSGSFRTAFFERCVQVEFRPSKDRRKSKKRTGKN